MRDRTVTPSRWLQAPGGFRARDVLPACFAFAVSLSIFLFTLAPTITFGDSGELITAAITLGVAHPPGYPLWLILAKFFSLFPVGTVAYRLNLMSAILGAAAVGVLTLAISRSIPKVCGRIIPAEAFDSPVAGMITGSASATAALVLAFSPTFWQQSVMAEVYALNNLFVCLIILLLIVWGETPQRRGPLLAVSLLLGAGFGNHHTILLMAPAIAIYVLARHPRVILSARMLSGCIVLFSLGLCLYLYLPLRASTNPPLNWGNPTTWDTFWFHVLRMQYRSIEVARPLSVLVPQLKFFFISAATESLPVVLLLPAFFTLWFAHAEGRVWLLFTLTVFVFTGILLVLLANTELDLNAQDLLRVYFLPAYMIVAVWIGYGISMIGLLALRSSRRLRREAVPAAAVMVLWLLLPASNLAVNYRQASMRGHDFGLLYGDMLINGMRQGAVLLAGTDSSYSIPMYMKWVEGRRPDISILSVNRLAHQNYSAEVTRNAPDLAFLTARDYTEAFSQYASAGESMSGGIYGSRKVALVNGYLMGKLFRRNISEKPMYYEEGMPLEWVRDFAVPSGLVVELKEEKVVPLPEEVVASDMDYWHALEVKLLGNDNFLSDIAARQKFSKCRSNIGALYLRRKMYAQAEEALEQAVRFSDRNIEAYAHLALMHRQQGNNQEAVRIFEEYLRRDPWNTSALAFAQSLRQ